MPRRVSPSQLRSMIRQAEQKQRQAINKYNREARSYNQKLKRAVDDYNRGVRTHNSRVRANRQRLRTELTKLANQGSSTRYVSYSTSVRTLHKAFVRVESQVDAGAWGDTGDLLLDLTEKEAANSVEVLNALLAERSEDVDTLPGLRETSLTNELTDISPELDQRWRGALFALDPRNPDAARHFCASSREIVGKMLEIEAPDDDVLESLPECPTTDSGKPTRRAKVQFLLQRNEMHDEVLEEFIETDLDNVVTLFTIFNEGTHGSAGRFDLHQLSAIKRRVEDAVRFLYRVIR